MVAEAVLLSFSLFLSGVSAQAKTVCAVKGSTVDLPCLAKGSKWYTMRRDGPALVQNEIPADGNHVTYASEEDQSTLRINDLRESDTNFYCCGENPELCWQEAIQLNVTDLQVMVFPGAERQTVTLMCSTSCRLTETPGYVWYRNGDLLYDDWSPWYQELVGSDQAVSYSCAVKGSEDLRAPGVSVDSITPTCFNVTYAGGRMCSYREGEPCSISHPRDVRVEWTPASQLSRVRLTCASSCLQAEHTWYRNRCMDSESNNMLVLNSSRESFSCAFKGVEHLPSADVCVVDNNCSTVNYVRRWICALEGSSVNILSEYSLQDIRKQMSKLWYKSSEDQAEEQIKDEGRAEYRDITQSQHILKISNLKKSDSAEYTFRFQRRCNRPKLPGVALTVTGLKVKLNPEVAMEGERVSLTCGTSCPLPGRTAYSWYMNGRRLRLPENQNKHLVLDPVSSDDAGNYSCAVTTGRRNISSTEAELTVVSVTESQSTALAAAAGASAALLVVATVAVFIWILKKTCSRSPEPDRSPITDQLNSSPLYENISAQPTLEEDHHYGRLLFSEGRAEELYATLQPSA